MNARGTTVSELLSPVTARLRNIGKSRIPLSEELPLRSELFGAEQMELYGGILAASHDLSSARGTDQLLARLDENEATLFNICRVLTEAVMADKLLTPAGEWLYDNFYLIEDQIRTAKRHLPKSYSRELPLLAKGTSANLPRVYDIALQAISHGDGRVDTESLRRFVTAYQAVANLQLGELWAIPIMLRLSLIENLRRVGVHVAAGRTDRNLADTWADEIIRVAAKDPKSLVLVIADMARSDPPMTTPFISELVRRLQGQGPALALPLTWIEQRLAESNQTIDQLVQLGNQQQAADQVSISNSINSLRTLGAIDWREFVETTSAVEQTLREDPSGVYVGMDFASRDHYRHAVEQLAKASPLSEVDVARTALRLAREATTSREDDNAREHVGFYLVDDGLADLEEAIKVRWSLREQFWRTTRKYPLLWYLGSIALITLGLAGALLVEAHEDGASGWLLGLVGILSLFAMSQLAVALVNWASPLLVKPHLLPRMDFSAGIPSAFQTLVVVPTMLSRESEVATLIEALEVRFLANQDDNVYFGLLTDFMDADQETLPEDDSLLRIARTGIEDLNRKYGISVAGDMTGGTNGAPNASAAQEQETRFFLFHRPRRWNPREGVWMGHERKRGKLADLNTLLRDGRKDAFSLVTGNTAMLANVKYVITLDTDTQLPREIAHQFVGAMAHPLNRPRLEMISKNRSDAVVTEGYGILQPRVAVTLSSTNRSRYAWLFGGEAGIDPYTRVVSDVYQDLFYEGSFVGKGIYDVDAFEQTVCRRFPENRILSHDLLEGCYARAGLLSDVQLYEQFPSRYSMDVSRRHRWIRGDWQLASWLLWRVPGPEGSYQPNPLSILSRWKLMDNLRRSLVPVALLLLLLAGWLALDNPWFWTLVVIGTLIIPSAITMTSDLLKRQSEVPMRSHIVTSIRTAGRHFAQNLFTLVCLPYEAYFSLDAILRTHVRLLITRRQLLEWTPSHLAEREHGSASASRWRGLGTSFRSMWVAPAAAVAAGAGMITVAPVALIPALPILLLWAGAPFIAWWISQPLPPRSTELSKGQIHFLREISRRTWHFFETFVGLEDNWLPPDNFQEHPVPTVAHRTSPTNMGLALLANVTAYDFGYIGPLQLIERTGNTLGSMETLERHAGHFYNWYDTQTKAPLTRYVSTVDSGNLAGHLLTLRAALLAMADRPIIHEQLCPALTDTLRIFEKTPGSELASTSLSQFGKALALARESGRHTLFTLHGELDRMAVLSREIVHEMEKPPRASTAAQEAHEWARALNRQCERALAELVDLVPSTTLENPDAAGEIPSLRQLANQGGAAAREHLAVLEHLAFQAGEMAKMEYGFLFNSAQRQLAIGYNVGEQRRDASYYDLLASEARFTNFVAIAQGELPQESWFALGRMLTAHDGETALLSWSGSMFEYLMPLLVMPTFDNTLLDQTCKAAVNRQIAYGRERGVPWGISESGYNAVDIQFNYQYRAFGVPGLGLKRGLGEDLVIAPYASVLALMVAPEAACRNLEELATLDMMGKFGFYEALDYTPSRLRRGEPHAIVRSFMAHHQGMSFLSLAYLLLDRPMQRRFDSEPIFQATMLLLQERIPKAAVIRSPIAELPDVRVVKELPDMPMRLLSTANTPIPEVQLLSNGRYHVMVTNSGAGSSRWKDLAVTRWREDGTCDYWGTFCYLRDVASGDFWSNTYQPTLKEPKRYGVVFSEGRVEFRRRDLDFDTHTEITVSPEDDIELRRVRITNRAWTRGEIEVTSYAEVVLAPAVADAQAPAFGNLFVQTEILSDRHAILCSRRPRSESDPVQWMFHLMTVDGVTTEATSYETDRMAFVGRGNDVSAPQAMMDAGPLSGSSGSVLDPVVAIRQRIMIEPGESAIVDIVTGAGDSHHAVMHLVEKYQDQHLKNRVFDLAWTHSLVVLRQLNATETDAQLFARMAGSILYASSYLRADEALLSKNRQGQSGLWGYAISGDLPIVLLQISDMANIDLVRQLVQAHAYWRVKGMAVDLVIWNEDHSSYRQQLHDHIMGLLAGSAEAHVLDRPGGIFIRRAEQIAPEDRILMQAVARVIILDTNGKLIEQLTSRLPAELPLRPPPLKPIKPSNSEESAVLLQRDLLFDNGFGGFASDAREYVITAGQDRKKTPVPWSNILANPHFGTVISESGHVYTWCENAHEYRLTPWHNDPVCDSSGEAYYLRDEESGDFWSPAPLPSPGAAPYVTRHGFGYSVFEHAGKGIFSELWVYVARDVSVKFVVLRIRNDSARPRRLSATGYVEWVLGDLPEKTRMHVVTEIDPASGVLLARNPYNNEFSGRIAFFDVDDRMSVTGDRTEFIGRNGRMRNPAGMVAQDLSGRVGAGLDPCGAIRVPFDLPAGATREVVFRLGAGLHHEEALEMARRMRGVEVARDELEKVRGYWDRTLGGVQVETPDPSVNVMANGWLLYQVIACRLWGRSGYYQSGGAFGFRDQLQDVMALVHVEPALVREHLLRAAARQFIEGDVQHWWHPPVGRGIRSRCSDDYLWLPLVTCHYVVATGDTAVLDERVSFLEGRPVGSDEESYYDLPAHSGQASSLYDHCVRAIVHGLRFGEHGLPLMGTGDWNDGMNLVGFHGRGESIWLAFFLYDILIQFSDLAVGHDDATFAERCRKEADKLRKNIERHGWDGKWYLRAYFDDGSPLGSSSNTECRIDSIAQSWSVLSRGGSPERQRQGMEAVDEQLVRRDARLIQLLDPPFDQSDLNPGYIKGYVPGVRENGGQYTHAAIWATMAFAVLRDHKRAWELLSMINPVNHGRTRHAVSVYKTEPYVVSADVYAVPPHTGRGGWSWYTGSAGWLYRLMLETLLGLTREGAKLHFNPCLPEDWASFTVKYRYGETIYPIIINQAAIDPDKEVVIADGVEQRELTLVLVDDRASHNIEVRVSRSRDSSQDNSRI